MVPVVDLSRRGARFAADFAAAAERIARSGSFLLGPETQDFEAEFGRFAGAATAAVSSGASALQLGLSALGVGPGDEVLVPAFTAVPTASAVMAVGATPVFCDVDAETACIDPVDALRAVTERTKAVIIVHLYGYPSELVDVGVPVVEDAAQAHGALDDPRRSALTAYSFFPTKNLGGIGDGGAVVSADEDLVATVRRLRAHGLTERYVHVDVSQNHRMSEVEAAWLRIALTHLDDDVRRRREIAASYRAAAPHLRWQATHVRHAYHLCVFRTADRERVVGALLDVGVATAVHYPLSLPDQPAFATVGGRACSEAAAWAAECVTVPCFPEMTDAEVETVGAALARLEPA